MAKKNLIKQQNYGQADNASPKITAEMFVAMRPAAEIFPDLAAASKRARGRPKVKFPRKVISMRVSEAAALAWSNAPAETRAKVIKDLEAVALQSAQKKYKKGFSIAIVLAKRQRKSSGMKARKSGVEKNLGARARA